MVKGTFFVELEVLIVLAVILFLLSLTTSVLIGLFTVSVDVELILFSEALVLLVLTLFV